MRFNYCYQNESHIRFSWYPGHYVSDSKMSTYIAVIAEQNLDHSYLYK